MLPVEALAFLYCAHDCAEFASATAGVENEEAAGVDACEQAAQAMTVGVCVLARSGRDEDELCWLWGQRMDVVGLGAGVGGVGAAVELPRLRARFRIGGEDEIASVAVLLDQRPDGWGG